MMRERLALAAEKRDKKKIAGIKQILNTENSKKNWGIVNATLDDPRSPPLTSIIRVEGDSQVRYDTEKGVEKVFMEECIDRYNLAKKAPIMILITLSTLSLFSITPCRKTLYSYTFS